MSDGAVLVVEDEHLISLDVEAALEEAGVEVVAAQNAAQAMAAFDPLIDPSIAAPRRRQRKDLSSARL